MKSLRLRLVLLLFVGLGVAWLVAAWFTHLESREEINSLFDAQIAQSAQVLLETTRHELHERIEHDDDEITVTHEYEQKLIFQIWDEHDLLLRSTTAPNTAMANSEEGYSEAIINGQPSRVLTRWDARHEFMIQVAEPLAGREVLARHITLKMLTPMFIVLPVLGILLWLGIGAGLRPLQQIKQEVKQRAAHQLQPLAMNNVPDEVAPLISALNDLFARLAHAFESERRFTADAAHELRTPLTALKIQAQVAARTQDDTERNLALAQVLRGVDRATHLIEQLLALTRVDPENTTLTFEQVNLRHIAVSVLADLAPLAQAKKLALVLEDGADCYVQGNQTQLSLMLRNLVDNAIRYTTEGSVTVALSNAGGVTLTVSDTGPGIAESEREQVQKRFYRITGSGEEGSGLGLSIVKRIAELHGAKLSLSYANAGYGLKATVAWGNDCQQKN
ncbi:MAG TPA: ATP-binding protein [Methylotenera sp.]|nr:ATP-binding protein [Methylotenera sp.]HPH05365.1 ATP-binding protein [Methylotenera sp.]HPN01291.1 ATP-binding protein [Methylotenera sp.]